MTFSTPPFIHLGIDARTGKSYHVCSHKCHFAATRSHVIGAIPVQDHGRSYGVVQPPIRSVHTQHTQFIPFSFFTYKNDQTVVEEDGTKLSKVHFVIMGLLDLCHGLMLFMAGGRTDPTQTLLFMQASIPVSACMSFMIYGVRYTQLQVAGMLIITAGLVLSVIPCIEDTEFEDREIGWNSVLYLAAAIPGTLSMLYKERVIRDQPVDMSYLNAWVSVNQFIAGVLAAPLIFDINYQTRRCSFFIWTNNPMDYFALFMARVKCQQIIVTNIVVNSLLLQLLRLTSVSTMYGCTLLGFVTSFVVLAWYQVDPDNFGLINLHDGLRNWIPDSVFVDVFACLIILTGKVLYQWDPDPEVETTTLSAEDKEAMSLLDGAEDYGLRYT
ncbi:hypothetical protein CCR75_003816 [Bremia lactucae]|uniref:Uncharacterized protein n=1 Tax=Bremia lactucae TaxID=4779 RepID=A0A976IDM3_BRELC|nr:hypothetical protein CCR75_003816 [Bremia lactucae]